MDIKQAAALGHTRLRRPMWANTMDHLQIDIIDGYPGPWVSLYCPFNEECNGSDPVKILAMAVFDYEDWLVYNGPLPDSDEYKAAVAGFKGSLAGSGER